MDLPSYRAMVVIEPPHLSSPVVSISKRQWNDENAEIAANVDPGPISRQSIPDDKPDVFGTNLCDF